MSAHDSAPRLVLVSCPEAEAEGLARRLVESRVAACVTRLAARSTYRWDGAIQDEAEALLVIKSVEARWPELQALLAEFHPHDVPECIALEPAAVEPEYLAWLVAETRSPGPGGATR